MEQQSWNELKTIHEKSLTRNIERARRSPVNRTAEFEPFTALRTVRLQMSHNLGKTTSFHPPGVGGNEMPHNIWKRLEMGEKKLPKNAL